MAHFEELPDSVHVDFTGQFDASSVSLSSLPIGQPYPAVYSESGTLHLPRDRTHGTRIDSGRSVRRFFGIAKSGPLAVPVEAAFAETRRSSSQYGSLHQRPQRKPSQFGVPAAERFVDHVTEQWDPKSFTTITTKVVAAPFQWYRKPHLRQEWLDAEVRWWTVLLRALLLSNHILPPSDTCCAARRPNARRASWNSSTTSSLWL